MGLKAHAGNDQAKRGQRLVVMIGGHAGSGRNIGEVDFGPAAASFDVDDLILPWYDHLFKNAQNEFSTGKPVKIFVLGANQWRSEDDWPLARAVTTKYFLHSSGKANSLRGDGALSITSPHSENPDEYVYDPANPAPTVGGPLCCDSKHLPPGPRDQRSVESRNDVLVYSTSPFANDVEVTGPVSFEFYAKSSAVDTDFTGKLVDVAPNGFAQNLTEGIIRARYRDSQEKPELLNPGQIYKLKLDLWATSNVFRKGHVLRLEVSSSNFPRFDRNPNSGTDANSAQQFIPATNTIYHDDQHPSALVLPIVAGPDKVGQAATSSGHFQFTNCISGATQVGQPHFRIFPGEDHAGCTCAERRQNCFLDALRCAFAVIGFGRDVDINTWPYQSLGSRNSLHRAFGLAINVI
jgi:hypothetical protein